MKRIVIRIVILLCIFILGVAGTSLFLNSEDTNDLSDMNSASLPEVTVELDGIQVNRMNGYRQKMQVDFTRDSVTPIDTSKTLIIVVNPHDAQVGSLSYEIRTSDGSKVLENQMIPNLTEEDGYLKAELQLTCDMRMNQEYSLQITLETGEEGVYYYTRIVQRSQLATTEYLNFATDFYEKCMDAATAEELSSYLETDAD